MSKKHITDIESKSIEDDETPMRDSHPKAGKSNPMGMVTPQRNIKEQHVTFTLVLPSYEHTALQYSPQSMRVGQLTRQG